MPAQDQIENLLNYWEDLQEQGISMPAEEICRDHPELLGEFKRQIARLQQIDVLLAGDEKDDDALSSAGRYQPLEMHAKGGLGDVFRAQDGELGRVVALKRIRLPDSRNPESCRRFEFEAKITGHLEHPGVVPVYGFERDVEGRSFYAMRLIRGDTLEKAIEQYHAKYPAGKMSGEGTLAFQQLLRSFLTVCQTIGYAHSQGVIHRDLKPANIMIGDYGETLVVDWGLAKKTTADAASAGDTAISTCKRSEWLPTETSETLLGDIKGSPAYMSPEQAAGDTPRIGPASDIYSLGATLYAILTGRKPISGNSLLEVLDNVKQGKFPPPRSIRSDAPPALEAICRKAMRLDPRDRYATPVALAGDIEHWLADEPVSAWREPWTKRTARWVKRHRTLVAALAAAVLVAAVGLGLSSAILAQKNQELLAANRVAEENFEQAHNALRNVVEFALHGRTLRDNVALTPVQLEILQRVVDYAEWLRVRKPDDRQLRLEYALLLTALGDVETRMNQRAAATKHFRTAQNLFGEPAADEAADWRHGRALLRLRLADVLPGVDGQVTAEYKTLVRQACADLARLAEQGQSGPLVATYSKASAPAILLTQGLTSLPELLSEYPQWLELADRRLHAQGSENKPAFDAESNRGLLWFYVAGRAMQGKVDIPLALKSTEKARAAFERCVALYSEAEANGDSANIFRWFIAQTQAMHAECLVESGKPLDGIAELRQACDAEERLVANIEARGQHLVAAWRTIDPTVASDAAATPGEVPNEWPLVLAHNLTNLANDVWVQGANARPDYERAERAVTAIQPPQDWPLRLKLELAQCQARLAAFYNQQADGGEKAKRLANAARQSLEGLRDPKREDLDIDFPLCQAYAILGNAALPVSIPEAVEWLKKARQFHASLGEPTALVPARTLMVHSAVLLADALSRVEPMPKQEIWNVSHDALAVLDSLRKENKDLADPEITRKATEHLAGSAMGLAVELTGRKPIPADEVAKVCDPACAALRRLPQIAGPLTEQETKWLEVLDDLRTLNAPEP